MQTPAKTHLTGSKVGARSPRQRARSVPLRLRESSDANRRRSKLEHEQGAGTRGGGTGERKLVDRGHRNVKPFEPVRRSLSYVAKQHDKEGCTSPFRSACSEAYPWPDRR